MKRLLHLALITLALTVLVTAPALAATIEELQRPYLNLVRAPQAQKVTKGEGIIVAVVDSGVDASHPDLKTAMLPGYHINRQSAAAANTDPNGHGTHMAGIIAARGGGYNNALGIAPRAKILPVAIDFTGTEAAKALAQAIRWAADHGAQVINLSLARPATEALTADERAAVAYAQSKDAVLIVGSGNTRDLTGGNNLAGLPGVLAVSAVTSTGTPWSGSEQRDYVAISAPGQNIVNAAARNIYSTGFSSTSGTSDAAAVVSGAAALIRAKYPDINAANVINRLIRTAVEKGEPGRDKVYGYGIVDAYAALTASVAAVDKNPLGTTSPSRAADPGGSAATGSKAGAGDFVQLAIVLAILGGVAFTIVQAVRKRRGKTPPGPPTSPASHPPGGPSFTPPNSPPNVFH